MSCVAAWLLLLVSPATARPQTPLRLLQPVTVEQVGTQTAPSQQTNIRCRARTAAPCWPAPCRNARRCRPTPTAPSGARSPWRSAPLSSSFRSRATGRGRERRRTKEENSKSEYTSVNSLCVSTKVFQSRITHVHCYERVSTSSLCPTLLVVWVEQTSFPASSNSSDPQSDTPPRPTA